MEERAAYGGMKVESDDDLMAVALLDAARAELCAPLLARIAELEREVAQLQQDCAEMAERVDIAEGKA